MNFENRAIRRIFDETEERWYFSVVDVVAVLTDCVNPRDYWFKMNIRIKAEAGIELSTICRQFKMKAPDGKMRVTDASDVQGLLRVIRPFRWTAPMNIGSSTDAVQNGFDSG